jgi:hypothetical protein
MFELDACAVTGSGQSIVAVVLERGRRFQSIGQFFISDVELPRGRKSRFEVGQPCPWIAEIPLIDSMESQQFTGRFRSR